MVIYPHFMGGRNFGFQSDKGQRIEMIEEPE